MRNHEYDKWEAQGTVQVRVPSHTASNAAGLIVAIGGGLGG